MLTMEVCKSHRLISYLKNFLYLIYNISLKPWWIFWSDAILQPYMLEIRIKQQLQQLWYDIYLYSM